MFTTKGDDYVTKELRCRDLGFDCEGVVKGATEEEVLTQVAAHAKEVHNMTEIPDDVVAKARSVMRDV